MSAWYCGAGHFSALVNAWVDLNRDNENRLRHFVDPIIEAEQPSGTSGRELMFKTLAAENVASLADRYENDWRDMVPAEAEQYDRDAHFPHAEEGISRHYIGEILMGCDCYEYQSCEHAGWEQSKAAQFTQRLRKDAYSMLPEYQTAKWGFDG